MKTFTRPYENLKQFFNGSFVASLHLKLSVLCQFAKDGAQIVETPRL
jgi:hypothetical protein